MQKRTPSPVGVRLKDARELVVLSARELDRLAGLRAEGHTSLIESGVVQNVTMDTAGKLASALGLTLDWLVSGRGEAPTAPSVQAAVDAARAAKASESGEHAAVDAPKTGTS